MQIRGFRYGYIPFFAAIVTLTLNATLNSQTTNNPLPTSTPTPAPRKFAETTITDLPGKGLAQHPLLYCGEWQQRGKSEQVMYIVRDGKIVWTYSIPGREEYGDCTRLSNRNIIFSRRLSASEITPNKKIVWHYDAAPNTETHTAQPIGKDRVLIMQNGNPAKALLINKKSGKIEKEIILPVRRPENVHGQFRHIRMTKAGTFLVAHLDLRKVVETTKTAGKSGRLMRLRPGPPPDLKTATR